ncbi:hypothetical protein [Rubritalea halochordaticola]|uniref:hypothetical protein n=1 Tax=Rubritalea halochordaticola TaxID=714537 RepID=UPI0031FD3324
MADSVDEQVKKGLLSSDHKKLWDIYAVTPAEASAIHALRMGCPPYKPEGNAKLCPNACGSHYYPSSSGVCPICGLID